MFQNERILEFLDHVEHVFATLGKENNGSLCLFTPLCCCCQCGILKNSRHFDELTKHFAQRLCSFFDMVSLTGIRVKRKIISHSQNIQPEIMPRNSQQLVM